MARTPTEADRSSSADRAILANGYDFLLTRPYRRVIAGILPHFPKLLKKSVKAMRYKKDVVPRAGIDVTS
jgi:hypothetical protein